jgi:hypothetical protein
VALKQRRHGALYQTWTRIFYQLEDFAPDTGMVLPRRSTSDHFERFHGFRLQVPINHQHLSLARLPYRFRKFRRRANVRKLITGQYLILY